METNKRIESLDAIRGLAILFILLFHSSIYNFANIHKLDFSHPPVVIVLMSFMALWGGMFVVYSLIVNTYLLTGRCRGETPWREYRYLAAAGLVILILHYLLVIFLGRWTLDFVNNQPHLTFIAGTLRTGHAAWPPATKLFDGTSLSTIAFNLILVGGLVAWLISRGGAGRSMRNYLVLGISGTLILLLSFFRVNLYPAYADAVANGHYGLAAPLGFLLANPYPLLPYLSYGLFGAMTGMMLQNGRHDLLKKVVLPAGVLIFVYGVAGMTQFDKTISKPDYFWYFKTCFELGLFLMLAVAILTGLEKKKRFLAAIPLLKWFGRLSLTVYLLETFTSEILRAPAFLIAPEWDQTINGCLLFGVANILLWSGILLVWRKFGFKYSIEHFWVAGFRKIGKRSTKMDPFFNPH